jgi:DNA-directed RNA polymerase subunit RPC12/RpoP
MLDFQCQRCGTAYHAEESHAGKIIRCRQCEELVFITRPPRPVVKCSHCGRPMNAPEGHALCGATPRASNFRFPRWPTAGGKQFSKRHFALLFSLVLTLAILGFAVNPFEIFRQGQIGSNRNEESSRISSAARPPVPTVQPFSPAESTSCGINDSMDSSGLANGTEILRPRRLNGKGKLDVENGNSTDAVVNLVDLATNVSVRKFYVQAHNRVTESEIASGIYQLRFATGRNWDSGIQSFTRCKEIQKYDDSFEFSEHVDTATGRANYDHYSITLHRVVGGNAHTTPIDEQSFEGITAQSE